MSDAAPRRDSTTPGAKGSAFELFERFLLRYHEGEGSFADLRREHPDHTELFERWWDQLVRSGEVTETPSDGKAAEMPEEGSHFGAYQIVRELGRGSQGTVFLAEDTRLSRRVALKVMPAYRAGGRDRSQRFAREAELASRLDHPGLCTVYERGASGSTAYLAMRFVDGESLAARIARARRQAEVDGVERAIRLDGDSFGRAAIDAVLALFERIAGALHAAHEANLIHRDVKPGNVVIDANGNPVLLDFGLARDLDSDVLTLTGDLVGTPAYMSPEQLAAHRIELDRRTDVFSLGATLYECLTLHRPFEAPTRNELYQQILAADPGPPRRLNPELPQDLEVVLLTALEKDRNRRYQTAAAFADELRRVRQRQPIAARPAGPLLRLRRWSQRNPTLAISITLVFLALAGGLGASLFYQARFQRARVAFERLSDFTVIPRAREAAERLHPPWPEQIDAMESWMQRFGRPLRRRLAEHREKLTALRARALPYTWEQRQADLPGLPQTREIERLRQEMKTYALGAEKSKRELVADSIKRRIAGCEAEIARLEDAVRRHHGYRFADQNEQTAHDELARLVAELEAFCGPGGACTRVEADLGWARQVERITIHDHAAAWRTARDEVRASKAYGERELRPQVGLVPLGKNPQGFLEFAHLRSGNVPPRGDDGALQVDGDTCIVFVLVPAGTFTMAKGLRTRQSFEWAPHEVALDWFFLSKYELSHGQWERLAGSKAPPHDLMVGGVWQEAVYPVQHVTWGACHDLLDRHGLRLPTEAQWERAAAESLSQLLDSGMRWRRLGNVRDRSWNEVLGQGGGRAHDDGHVLTAPIDAFDPNGLGLYNIFGNVSEWCQEYFAPIPLDYVEIHPGDGRHEMPRSGYRATRGGAFDTPPNQLGVSRRGGRLAEHPGPQTGVRPARPVF